MEIYRNTTNTVDVGFSDPSVTTSVVMTEAGVVLETYDFVSAVGNNFYVDVPLKDVTYEKRLLFTSTHPIDGYQTYREVDVVNPYLTVDEIRTISYMTNALDTDCIKAERVARYIVNAYVGHDFSLRNRTFNIEARAGNVLMLPTNLVVLKTINGVPAPGMVIDGGDLRYPYIADPYGYNWNQKFVSGRSYAVNGLWGYFNPPDAVKEAMYVIVEEMLCKESVWRDRYINYLTTDSFSLRFDNQAFMGTGNVKVDEILLQYRESNLWMI